MPRGWNGQTKRNLTTAAKQKAKREAEISKTDNRMAIMLELRKLDRSTLLKIAQSDPDEVRRDIAARLVTLYA